MQSWRSDGGAEPPGAFHRLALGCAILPLLQSLGQWLLMAQFSLYEQRGPSGEEPAELNAGALGETPLVNTKNPNEGWSLARGSVGSLWGCPCPVGPVCAAFHLKLGISAAPSSDSIHPSVGVQPWPRSSGVLKALLPLIHPCAGALVF